MLGLIGRLQRQRRLQRQEARRAALTERRYRKPRFWTDEAFQRHRSMYGDHTIKVSDTDVVLQWARTGRVTSGDLNISNRVMFMRCMHLGLCSLYTAGRNVQMSRNARTIVGECFDRLEACGCPQDVLRRARASINATVRYGLARRVQREREAANA